jgi:hypothetical protein
MHDRVVLASTGSLWTNLHSQLDEKHIPVSLGNPLNGGNLTQSPTEQNDRLATGTRGITNLDHNIFHECAPLDVHVGSILTE